VLTRAAPGGRPFYVLKDAHVQLECPDRAHARGRRGIIFLLGFRLRRCRPRRFQRPVKGTPEMVSMSIVIICFLLAGYSVQSGSMISTDASSAYSASRRASRNCCRRCSRSLLRLIVWVKHEPTLHAIVSGEYEGEG
jgi:hypothetical protein